MSSVLTRQKEENSDRYHAFFLISLDNVLRVFRQQRELLLKLEGDAGMLLIKTWATGAPAASNFSTKGGFDVQFSVQVVFIH